MCAYLRVTGEKFDVDSFLAGSSITPDVVFYRGQAKKRLKEQTWLYSGFGLEIGGEFGRLSSQINEVASFLEEERSQLVLLSKFPGVSDMRVILSYCPGNSANMTEYLPPMVLDRLGSIGIGIEFDVYAGDNKRT